MCWTNLCGCICLNQIVTACHPLAPPVQDKKHYKKQIVFLKNRVFYVEKIVSLLKWLLWFRFRTTTRVMLWLVFWPSAWPWPPSWPRACVICFDSCINLNMAIPQTKKFWMLGWWKMIYWCILVWIFPESTKPIAPFHCEDNPKVTAAPQINWFYSSRVCDDFHIDVIMLSARNTEFVVRSCEAAPPSQSPSGQRSRWGAGNPLESRCT